ncbi:MAG: gamma-glutamylcyclotransferase [Acidobacteriota bacterium]|nr:gamma-glutamylcyclotransferase [Acidobacteriota bacterium]
MRTRDRKAARCRSPSEHPIPVLALFVYGTLKRGFRNHQAFCRGFVEFREATVRGRLYEGPGYPILKVPEADILAQGTTDPLADAATQTRLSHRVQAGLQRLPEGATGEIWDIVCGELFTFDDPRTRLHPIDRLEGFHPGGRSLYRRVLVPATVEGARQPAWVYAVEDLGTSRRRITSGRWPE